MRLIDADALLEEVLKEHLKSDTLKLIVARMITNAPTIQREGWVSDAKRYQWLKNNNATVIKVETEKLGYRSTLPNAPKERWFEFEGFTVSTLPVLHESYKTMDEAVDAAMIQAAPKDTE